MAEKRRNPPRSAGAESSLIYARYCPNIGEQLTVADYDLTGTGYGVGGSYKVNDALALQVAYASNDWDADTSYGVGFTYDLGGATLGGAAGSINGVTKADLGVNFSF